MIKKIKAKSIRKEFFLSENLKNNRIIINDICISFEKSKSYAIIGKSGVGKSTLLHILAGIDAPTSGSVLFDSENIYSLSPERQASLRAHEIGVVFQQAYYIKELTVLENCMIKQAVLQLPAQEATKQAKFLLEQLDLSDYINECPAILSGGQQHRLALARALFGSPSFLFLDEPTASLDQPLAKKLINFLLDWQKKYNMGLIISTHDLYVYSKMQEVYTIKNGVLM